MPGLFCEIFINLQHDHGGALHLFKMISQQLGPTQLFCWILFRCLQYGTVFKAGIILAEIEEMGKIVEPQIYVDVHFVRFCIEQLGATISREGSRFL